MTAEHGARLVLHVALFLLAGWSVRRLLLDRLLAARAQGWAEGSPERALLSLFGGVAFSLAAMLLHLLSGGAVFGLALVVPLFAGILIALATRAGSPFRLRLRASAVVVLLGLALVLLYVLPVLSGGSSVRIGDPAWHLGWSEQLLAGEPVPTGPAPHAVARNSYPWGFHAVIATLVRLVPGSDPLSALDALHVLMVFALPLAAACLARRIDPRCGTAAAAAMALVGGWGWIKARGPAFIGSPSDARYGADLVAASPNAVYELLPPAFPRELALVLLALSGVLLIGACGAVRSDGRSLGAVLARRAHAGAAGAPDARGHRRNPENQSNPENQVWLATLAGVVAGCVGLLNVPLFGSALLWLIFGSLWARSSVRRVLLPATGAALVVFALWAGPVVSDYVRFGGFVNITPKLGKEWPLGTALASWGLLVPAAAAGLVVASKRAGARGPIYGIAVATGLLLALSIARSRYVWDLEGNATLLHQGRVWPVAHLLGAVFAGVAVAHGYQWLRRWKLVALPVGTVALAVAAASPVLASVEVSRMMRAHDQGYVYAAPYLRPGSFARKAAAALHPTDVVFVEESKEIAFLIFQFSGARLACYDDPQLARNDLRIRFAELAADWDERVQSRGFPAGYEVVPASGAVDDDYVVRGIYKEREWVLRRLPERPRECPEANGR